jgi:hypothetical protein
MTVAIDGSAEVSVDPSSPDPWAEADLVRRVCLGFGIATRAITIIGQDGFRDDDEPEGSFGPNKIAAETAMLLHVTASVRQHASIEAAASALSALVAAGARSERSRLAIALNPAISLQLAMPHVLLSRLDAGDERLDRLIDMSATSLAHDGNEVLPHRALERLWIESLRTGNVPDDHFERAASESVLNHPVDMIWGSRDDAYAHTHALMYYSDFGYAGRPLPRSCATILRDSEAMLARALLLEDYDLAAELLMAWPMTREPWSPAGAFGFRVLAELEDEVGFLPAKNGTPEKFYRLTGVERTRYALAASYHTAYVWAMLCAMSLRPDLAPPTEIQGPAGGAQLVDELLAAIPNEDTPWRRSFDRLGPAEQQHLSSFLLDMALLANAREHDYAAVANVLEIAVRQDRADSPVCAQSVELLQRLSVAQEFA